MDSDDDDDDDDDDDQGVANGAVAPQAAEGKVETHAVASKCGGGAALYARPETKTGRMSIKWLMTLELLKEGWETGFGRSHQTESRCFAYVAARYISQKRQAQKAMIYADDEAADDEAAERLLNGSELSGESADEVRAFFQWNYMGCD